MNPAKRYHTRLGEAGVKVSGGQKQRIAIARAILKDAPIIILDEGTSHADVENERKIHNALDHLLQDKMAIIIAHRLHTIQHASRIYVFRLRAHFLKMHPFFCLMKRLHH